MDAYQTFIFLGHYARRKPDGQRETWSEAVNRYLDFVLKDTPQRLSLNGYSFNRNSLYQAIYNLEVMPSMRAMMTAGPAAERDNTCIYNCAYTAVDHLRAFAEILYILMSGTGVGFSCEKHYIALLPPLPAHITSITGNPLYIIQDSKLGWAEAFLHLLENIWTGVIPHFSFDAIRPAGAPLLTMGGRASGPEPLQKLFKFVTDTCVQAAGRQLRSREVHDIVCSIADIVVVGGVRRSALISLSDLADTEMAQLKSGAWWEHSPWLALSNNSAVYCGRPTPAQFRKEWNMLQTNKSGERGIFNTEAARRQAGSSGRRIISPLAEFGTNPCSEILLRNGQFCNLTEVVVRATDTVEKLKEKVAIATYLGTLQARFTHFPFLGSRWNENCVTERLLGVSLTGICDHNVLSDVNNPSLPDILQQLRATAVAVNRFAAGQLGISVSAAITCVKPSGTVSQLVDSASGIHPRWSQYYIRTVRIDKKDPLYYFMRKVGVPCEDDLTNPKATAVMSFPIKTPAGARLRKDMSAVDQLNLWLLYQRNWCEHKPSCTVYIRDTEWDQVRDWVWNYFDEVSGIAFLPYDNGTYKQAPYEKISAQEYAAALEKMPTAIDWSGLTKYENAEQRGKFLVACGGQGCELVDLV